MSYLRTNVSRALVLLALASSFVLPMSLNAQESAAHRRHRHAVEAQRASDHHHHTGAKIVVGSAVGGAVVGGLLGGGKGALIGGALGAGGGAIANKTRENHDVKKRQENDPR
jgi:outer membrane lipoprotein SlyB